jgi:hypothetical protein
MAKQTGIGDYLAVDDSGGALRNISNDVTNFSVNTTQGLQDVTGLDKSAIERLILLGDGSFSISGVFNPASNMSHDVFKVKSGVRTVTYAVGGNTNPNPELSMECLVASYNLTRAADGSLTWSAELQLADGTVPTWGTVT